MFNPMKKNEIVFPHFIPTTNLIGVQYSWQNVVGGAKMIGSFGLTTNTFLGGQCIKMGFVPSLGFWGCLDKHNEAKGTFIGFYLSNPDEITEYGKEVLANVLPDNTIGYVLYDDLPHDKTEQKKIIKMQKQAELHGISPTIINSDSVNTLATLLEAAIAEEKLEKEAIKPRNIANDLIKKSTEQRKKVAGKY